MGGPPTGDQWVDPFKEKPCRNHRAKNLHLLPGLAQVRSGLVEELTQANCGKFDNNSVIYHRGHRGEQNLFSVILCVLSG